VEEVFDARRLEARRRGRARLARFWVRELAALAPIAVRERVHDRRSRGHIGVQPDPRGVSMLETLLTDTLFAFRLMRRTPGFSALVLLTLAVGIGANSVMFSVVNTVLLRPLPYANGRALTLVRPVDAVSRRPGFAAPPDFYRYRAQNRSFDRLDAFSGRN